MGFEYPDYFPTATNIAPQSQLLKHETLEPVSSLDPVIIRSSLTWDQALLEVTFFVAVKSFEANATISGNFVLTPKNSITCSTGWHQSS